MEDIRRRCNPIVDLLKFTSNKKILSELRKKTIIYNFFLNNNFMLLECIKNMTKFSYKIGCNFRL